MSAAPSLKKDIFGLAAANAVDYALQFLVPMVVARTLSPEDFGGYRMAWLVASTIIAFAPLHIPHSLSYFLPRLEQQSRIAYIVSAFALLLLTSLLSALAVNPWFPLLPLHWMSIGQPMWFFPLFVALWVMGSLTDWLAVSDGRAQWQAKAIMTLSLLRTLLIALTAWWTSSLQAVLLAMLAFAVLKVLVIAVYLKQYHKQAWALDQSVVRLQFNYAWPFGIADGFYLLRQQAEQWMVAALFGAREFASFSLGGVAAPLFTLLRQSVHNAVLPKLSALHAQENYSELAALNRKATTAVSYLLIPAACILYVYAEEVISLIYTPVYHDAAAVMRVYLIGFLPQIFESTALLRVAGYGAFGLSINAAMLPLAIGASYFGIAHFGLPGGAFGSVLCSALTQGLAVRRVTRGLNIPFKSLYDFRAMSLYFLLAVGSSMLSFYVVQLLSNTLFFRLFVGGMIAASIFILLTYWMHIMPTILSERLSHVFRK